MKKKILIPATILLTFVTSYAKDVTPSNSSNDSISKETLLNEVVVKAPLVRREADRIVLNISANPLSANKNAQELLQTAPGVWADDNKLSIYGQGGTSVYIDDRKVNMTGSQLMTYLKTIQSSSIASIEIIPKGGAEYNADSSGGIIKINLKRNRIDGISGSAGLNLTSGEYKQWINPFLNFSLHSGKWTVSLNGNLNGSPYERYTSYEESSNSILLQNMSGSSHHDGKVIQGNVMLGLFYEPSAKDKLGLQFDYNPDRKHHSSNSETSTYGFGFFEKTYGKYKSDERFNNINVSFNWSRTLDDRGSVFKLISNYNFQNSDVNENNEMKWSNLPNDSVYITDNSNRYNIFVTDASLRKVFNSNWTLNTGVKYTFNNVLNRSFHHFLTEEGWFPNTKYNYDTSYNENILGIYASASGKAGRWKFKAGIRGEYYQTENEMTSKKRFDLFPNANIVYNITDNEDYTVALGYYRNIRRPSFHSLNPTAIQVSDYFYTVGNPNLTQSMSNGFNLDFLLARKFTVALGYSETSNPIRQVFDYNPEHPERLYLTWGNEGKDRNFYAHVDGSHHITKWWNLYGSLTYVLKSQKLSDETDFETLGYVQIVMSTSFSLPRDFNFTINTFYNSKMMIGNITVYPILNINPTLQKRFGKHWSLSLGVENMLQRKNRIRTVSSVFDRFSYTKSYVNAHIGVTYNFNSGKKFKTPRVERSIDNSRLSND
ncbi:MAG: outer membrane beta-barrel family protein [Muribaculaceae bacterium]|nr:outer membrane beta-barrel family protein [Muribaculaceae bacterium]